MHQIVRLRPNAVASSVRLADNDRRSLARIADFLLATGHTELAARVIDILYHLLDAEVAEATIHAFPSGRHANPGRDSS